MLRSQIAARGFRFVLWEAAAMPSQVSQDSSLVLDREFLRTAVIDPTWLNLVRTGIR